MSLTIATQSGHYTHTDNLSLIIFVSSSAIEQDADMVIFIDRPAMYGIESFDGGRYGTIFSQGVGRLTIAKNREGTTGYIPFRHNESLTVISDYAVQTSNTEIG